MLRKGQYNLSFFMRLHSHAVQVIPADQVLENADPDKGGILPNTLYGSS